MKHIRWFNWSAVGVLLTLVILATGQFVISPQVVSAKANRAAVAQAGKLQNPFECPFTPEEFRSIHAEYIQGIGEFIPVTKDGPTGIEGGLYMLRFCK